MTRALTMAAIVLLPALCVVAINVIGLRSSAVAETASLQQLADARAVQIVALNGLVKAQNEAIAAQRQEGAAHERLEGEQEKLLNAYRLATKERGW